jgi:hypothetical protein
MSKVAIVGSGSSYRDAPYEDFDWEIWGVKSWIEGYKRVDVVFDLHEEKIILKRTDEKIEKPEGIDKDSILLPYKRSPFPFEEIIETFPEMRKEKNFRSSVSWILALAIYLKIYDKKDIDEIGIWGVDMLHDTEYAYQLPSASYWIGFARGMRIKVTIPDSSALLKNPFMYCYGDESAEMLRKVIISRIQDNAERINELNYVLANKSIPESDRKDIHNEIQQRLGQLNNLRFMKNLF